MVSPPVPLLSSPTIIHSIAYLLVLTFSHPPSFPSPSSLSSRPPSTQDWISDLSSFVKSLDPNHLVAVGSEGFYGPSSPSRSALNAEPWMSNVGTDFLRNNALPNVDIATFHAYFDSR